LLKKSLVVLAWEDEKCFPIVTSAKSSMKALEMEIRNEKISNLLLKN